MIFNFAHTYTVCEIRAGRRGTKWGPLSVLPGSIYIDIKTSGSLFAAHSTNFIITYTAAVNKLRKATAIIVKLIYDVYTL
jgi:hypothetical protein